MSDQAAVPTPPPPPPAPPRWNGDITLNFWSALRATGHGLRLAAVPLAVALGVFGAYRLYEDVAKKLPVPELHVVIDDWPAPLPPAPVPVPPVPTPVPPVPPAPTPVPPAPPAPPPPVVVVPDPGVIPAPAPQSRGPERGDVPPPDDADVQAAVKAAQTEAAGRYEVGPTVAIRRTVGLRKTLKAQGLVGVPDLFAGTGFSRPADMAERIKKRNAEAARGPKLAPASSFAPLLKPNGNVPPGLPRPDPTAKAFSWRNFLAVVSAKDQGACGSCYSFGATAAGECSAAIRNLHLHSFSEQYGLSCYSQSGGCGGGNLDFLDGIKTAGVALTSHVPYKAGGFRCPQSPGPLFHAANWGYVGDGNSSPTVQQIKQAICEHGPVAVTITANGSFQAYTGGVYEGSAWGSTNHIVCLVGWDDTKGSHGAWDLKNSWSTDWGVQGFCWIGYGSNRVAEDAAWVDMAPEPPGVHDDGEVILTPVTGLPGSPAVPDLLPSPGPLPFPQPSAGHRRFVRAVYRRAA